MNSQDRSEHAPQDRRGKWVLVGFLLIAAYFLWAEHRAHLMGALPYLLLLACPLMHLFHHHGHGNHRHSEGKESGRVRNQEGGES